MVHSDESPDSLGSRYGPVVLAAFLPLVGVLVLDWSVYELVLVYWIEAFLTGAFVMLRLYLQPPWGVGLLLVRLYLVLLVALAWLSFAASHLLAILALLHPAGPESFAFPEDPRAFLQVFRHDWLLAPTLFLLVPQSWDFLRSWVIGRGWERVGRLRLVLGLFARLLVTQVAVVLAAFLVLYFDMPLLMLVVIVLAKLGIDVAVVSRQRRDRL